MLPSMTQVTQGTSCEVLLRPSPTLDPEVLRISGARKSKQGWLLPRRLPDIEVLQDNGINLRIPDDVRGEWERRDKLDRYLRTAEDIQRTAAHPSWAKLDGHQRVGVAYLTSRPRALLAYSPGLGKTACAVIAAETMGFLPALVVAPLTLLPTWRDEIGRWGNGQPVRNLRKEEPGSGWNLLNPDQLKKRLPELKKQGYRVVIFDESVLYKSRRAQRTKKARELAQAVPNVWMLSGAPITAYADDLWAQLNILYPEWFRSYWRFARQWTFLNETAWGTKVVGNKRPKRLRTYLRDIMLSRTPEQVPVLPDAPVENIRVELTPAQVKALRRARDEFQVGDENLTNVLTQLLRMAQIVSYPAMLDVQGKGAKLPALRELLTWARPPYLIWVWFRETAELLKRELGEKMKVEGIHGGVSAEEREDILSGFQEGKLDALVMQIGTGRYGLSLTGARTAIFYDRSFSVDDWIQATARVRRRSSTGVVPTYVLDGGWTDALVNTALKRKLRSVTDLDMSDLLRHLEQPEPEGG